MKSTLLAFLFMLSSLAINAAEIASVNFDAIKDELREYYFAKPGNSELKEKFETAIRDEKAFQEEIQKKIMDGNKPIDLRSAMPKGGMPERYRLEKKIDTEIKRELYLIISGLGLKYDFIYDSTDSEAVIYSKNPVDDITTTVRQAIIDLQRKKE